MCAQLPRGGGGGGTVQLVQSSWPCPSLMQGYHSHLLPGQLPTLVMICCWPLPGSERSPFPRRPGAAPPGQRGQVRWAWLCVRRGMTPSALPRPEALVQFSSVQWLSRVQLFATPWTAACQASLSITNSWNLLKLMSIESVMPSNHLILCRPLLPPSIFSSIRVFSNESALHIRWPKYWSFSFSMSPSNEYSGLIFL